MRWRATAAGSTHKVAQHISHARIMTAFVGVLRPVLRRILMDAEFITRCIGVRPIIEVQHKQTNRLTIFQRHPRCLQKYPQIGDLLRGRACHGSIGTARLHAPCGKRWRSKTGAICAYKLGALDGRSAGLQICFGRQSLNVFGSSQKKFLPNGLV